MVEHNQAGGNMVESRWYCWTRGVTTELVDKQVCGAVGYYGGGGGQYVGGCYSLDGAGGGGSGFLSSQFIGSGEFSR